MKTRASILALVALVAGAGALGALASRPAGKLPPGTLRGPAYRLDQYPTVSLATPAQLRAARRLLRTARAAARQWRDPGGAAADGYRGGRARRRAGDRSPRWLHLERRRTQFDDGSLRPRAPKSVIYADVPGRPLVLVGVMYALRRGVHGPSPGGPITRWHTHRVCIRGNERGVKVRPDGSCPRGTRAGQGSEMLHIWFTRDLRSAFAIHAPVPELCVARLLPRSACGAHAHHSHG